MRQNLRLSDQFIIQIDYNLIICKLIVAINWTLIKKGFFVRDLIVPSKLPFIDGIFQNNKVEIECLNPFFLKKNDETDFV